MRFLSPSSRLFVVLLLLCLPMAALAQRGTTPREAREAATIVVGGDRSYPPYEFLDKNGLPAGYNVELTRAIARVMGFQVEFRLGHWADVRRDLDSGQIDILQGIVYSEERAKDFEFTPPHTIVHQSLFARKGSPAAHSFADLKGKQVLVLRDGIDHETLQRLHPDVFPIPANTNADALQQLAAGKYDYALMAKLPGLYLIRELGLSNLVSVGDPLLAHRYGYATDKGNAALAATFGEGLAILKNTGEYQTINDKWLGVLEPRGITWKDVAWKGALVFAPLLLFLGLMSFWSWSLKRQVALRTKELTQEVAERRRTEEELRRNQEQLLQAAKMAALGVLVSGVAHEINNPNGLILLNLQMIKDVLEDAEPIFEEHCQRKGDFVLGNLRYSRLRGSLPRMMAEALDASRKVKRIVEDLKDFGRQRAPDLREGMSLNLVVETSVRLVANLLRKSTSNLVIEYEEGMPTVRGNAQRMEQVVVNLLMNACQALPDRDKGIRLSTYVDEARQAVCLEIRDEGVGIPEEHMERITDPFFTTKRDKDGTGLGLAVSAGIVKEHGGILAFESTPGRGTLARILLPLSRKELSA
ncbi:MAG TPA: transporter substrate-binding domain-containing protein [Holophaga sp.]|nr:transporter substrate-binding domain-containing protein [Holophaga sp.]